MALTKITVEALGRQQERTAFHCGAEALDRHLKQRARQDAHTAIFYRHFGFLTLQAQPSRLFVPMRLVAQLPS